MPKAKKDKHFLKKPVYEGGPTALKRFIASNLKYPEEASANNVEGTVYLRYTIDYLGNVIGSKIISGLGYGCDEEAQRLVSLLKFKVKRPRGLKIKFHKTIQIHFRQPGKKQKPLEFNYQLTKTGTKTSNNPKDGDSYSFTINLD